MKYVKLSIVIAVILGIVVIATTQKADKAIDIQPSTEKERTVMKYIHDKIINAPDSKFCPNAYDEILKTINLFFENETTNKKTYTNELQYEYTEKFVKQAMYVFDRSEWKSSDISTIRKEHKRCLSFSPNNSDLKTITTILREYDNLQKFNDEVSQACRQQPKCITVSANYLYIDDDWDIAKTNDLINRVPSASTKAKNSPTYQNTRKPKVEQKLKSAHKKFIDDKMDCAESEAMRYNYNSSRHGDWEQMVAKLYVNFKTYNNKWGESVSAWQRRAASWEQYTIPRTLETY